MPVAPDLAKTVKVGSDHSKNLTSVLDDAKNERLSFKTICYYEKFNKINFFFLKFCCAIWFSLKFHSFILAIFPASFWSIICLLFAMIEI